MTFFYDLNKKLDSIREKPETTHKQLNERAMMEKISPPIETDPAERGKYKGKDIGDLKAMKSAHLKHTAAQREAGKPVSQADKEKTAELNFAIRAKQAHGGKWGKIKEDDIEEGPEIFKLKADAAKKAGEKTFQGPDGKTYPVKEAARPDFPDIDNDGNKKESIKKAAADAAAMKEASQDNAFTAHKRPREETPKTGDVEHGSKHDIKHGTTDKRYTGRIVTRRADAQGISVGTDDDAPKDGEKRGRGRPKKTDKAPERVTSKAYKHKGGRKMSKEEIEEAIAALEEAGYSVEERKLTKPELKKREEVVRSMKKSKGDFEKRYGDRGEEVMYATATKLAKKKAEEVEETTVAGSVAPSTAAPKSKGKGGMTFGKGIYDSLNRDLEAMISESMNVSVNMSMDEHGEPRKNITVSAEGEAAEQLAQLLNLAGLAAHGGSHSDVCSACGQADCGCEEMVDENAPDWPTNTEMSGEDDPHLQMYADGLNGPKSTGQTVGAPFNRQNSRQGAGKLIDGINEESDIGMKLYAELKSFKG